MDKENKKTLWLLLGVVAAFGGLFLMISGKLDSLLGNVLIPGYSSETEDGEFRKPSKANIESNMDYKAKLVTSAGDIVIDLYELDTPYAVTNFIYLAENDFYDGLTFHRVVKDVLIQGGDPNGDGTGDPGYTFDDEIRNTSVVKGSVGMASGESDSNGSQFFIITKEAQPHLDRKQTIFGEVLEGMNVVQAIASVSVEDNGSGEISKPINDVVIEDVEIVKESYSNE